MSAQPVSTSPQHRFSPGFVAVAAGVGAIGVLGVAVSAVFLGSFAALGASAMNLTLPGILGQAPVVLLAAGQLTFAGRVMLFGTILGVALLSALIAGLATRKSQSPHAPKAPDARPVVAGAAAHNLDALKSGSSGQSTSAPELSAAEHEAQRQRAAADVNAPKSGSSEQSTSTAVLSPAERETQRQLDALYRTSFSSAYVKFEDPTITEAPLDPLRSLLPNSATTNYDGAPPPTPPLTIAVYRDREWKAGWEKKGIQLQLALGTTLGQLKQQIATAYGISLESVGFTREDNSAIASLEDDAILVSNSGITKITVDLTQQRSN